MDVAVLGVVAVRNGPGTVSGSALGGRRARVALVALALAGGPVPADRLAAAIWGDDVPPTWPAALRGVIRGVRSACDGIGGGEQQLISTAPSGYRLADGVRVDVWQAAGQLRRAAQLLAEGRAALVLDIADPITRLVGEQLLAGEGAEWLDPHRRAIRASAQHARQLVVEAAGLLGQHQRAIEAARTAVEQQPLDEGVHRALIVALQRSGDRAGAVQAYEGCRALLSEELGIDPSSETIAAYLAALGDEADATSHPARLPTETTSFVGRAQELAELSEQLARPGLITVTGKGGVGKSRLAVRAATTGREFVGGRLWVPLAVVAEDALVASSVALQIGVSLGADDAAQALAEYLAPQGRVLLVLDSCEVVVDGVASLVANLLERSPLLTILATSRVPLSVEGERLLKMLPWPAPDPADSLSAEGPLRLLLDRVRESGGELSIDDAVAPDLIALCQRCGGLPLALELVAAQLAAMPAGDLLDHLSDISGETDGLRSVARSSYQLLEDDEAAVFRRLAVLDGPVGLQLVRQVVSGGPIAAVRVVRILRELTARGLLTVDRTGARWRYEQEDDLHRFARELLVEHGEEPAAYDRLADAIRACLPEDARANPAPFRAEINDLLPSVRSLFGAALAGRAPVDRSQELAFRLHRYFATTNVDEGRFWLARLLADQPATQWTAYATYSLGYLGYWAGDTGAAMRDLERAVALLNGTRDSYRARALIFLAGMLDDIDRGPEAVEHVRLSIDAAAAFDVDVQVSAAMGMGSVLAERVDPAAARCAADAIELCRRGGSSEQLAMAMPTAAMICFQVGELEAARAYIAEALPMHVGTRRIARVVLLSAAAGVALADGDLAGALEFASTAAEEAEELGVEREVPLIRAILARARLARGELVGAAESCVVALDTARKMAIGFPFAIGLETSVLILHRTHRAGLADEAVLARLLAVAAGIRARGDRPAPAPLAGAINEMSVGLPVGVVEIDPLDGPAAAAIAIRLLAAVEDTVAPAVVAAVAPAVDREFA